MDYINLGKILHETSRSPVINWKNKSILKKLKKNKKDRAEFSRYLFNQDDNHGYFALLKNLTKNIDNDGIIVEVGNREGLGILSIFDGLKENQTFSIDIIDDIRFVSDDILKDNRVNIINDFNSLDKLKVANSFKEKSISLIFFDTIHTYEQIVKEIEVWSPYLKDGCVILVDDIRPVMEDRTKWKWHQEVNYRFKYDVTEWAHNDTGFGVYLK